MEKKGLAEAMRGDGYSLHVPSWKLYENPSYDGLAAAVVAAAMAGKKQSLGIHEEGHNLEDASFLPVPGVKVGRSTTPNAEKPAVSMSENASLSMPGSDICNHESQAITEIDVTQDRPYGAIRRQCVYGNGRKTGESWMTKGTLNSKEQNAGEFSEGRSMLKSSGRSVSRGKTQLHCKDSAQATEARAFGEEDAGLWELKPSYLPSSCKQIESPGSPCSHLQPRPPSSTSASPCSCKPVKAPTFFYRSPNLIESSQQASPPLKTITLMRPKSAGDGLSMQKPVSRSASSSDRSLVLDDGIERTCTQNYILGDADIITSPRDYLKTSSKPCDLFQGKQMENSPVFNALSEELKRALTRVHELEHFQASARKEVDGLLGRFAEERELLKNREQEKTQAAVFLLEEELSKERKVRKKVELENRKLSRCLAEAKRTILKAEKDLEKEKKARQLMEDVCDELAREIGEDKAEVEEMKREHARAREEIQEERRTLQMTEAWREERVQMKLSDAKYELEERCVALDKLTIELELFLNARQQDHGGGEVYYDNEGEDLRIATQKLKAEASSYMHFLESGSSHGLQLQDDTLASDDMNFHRDNMRRQSKWIGKHDARVRDRTEWPIDYGRELGKGITVANHIKHDSDEILSTFHAYPNAHKSSSWFSPEPIPRWVKNKASIAGLVAKCNGLTFDGSDSAEERSLDEENGLKDDIHTTWRQKRFGAYEIEESKGNANSNMNAFRGELDEEGDASEERDSVASSSPEFMRRSKQRSQDFFSAGKKPIHQNFLPGPSQSVDDVDGASSVTGLSSPIYEYNGDGLDWIEHREDWPFVPIHGSSWQGRRAAATSNAVSQRRSLPHREKLSSGNHCLQSTFVHDDRRSGLHLQARHPKGPRLTR